MKQSSLVLSKLVQKLKQRQVQRPRELLIYQGGPGLSRRRMIWLPPQPLPHSPVSMPSLFLSLPVFRRSSLHVLTGGEEGAKSYEGAKAWFSIFINCSLQSLPGDSYKVCILRGVGGGEGGRRVIVPAAGYNGTGISWGSSTNIFTYWVLSKPAGILYGAKNLSILYGYHGRGRFFYTHI